jgi:hypothetical protein
MRKQIFFIFILSACGVHSAFNPTVDDGVYKYADGIELTLEIKGNECELTIWEGGPTVCNVKGTFNLEREVLKIQDRQQFNSEVEEDLYNIYRCDLDYWEVTIVGEDSIQVGSFVLTRKR